MNSALYVWRDSNVSLNGPVAGVGDITLKDHYIRCKRTVVRGGRSLDS